LEILIAQPGSLFIKYTKFSSIYNPAPLLKVKGMNKRKQK
jgi:hypothetical protein